MDSLFSAPGGRRLAWAYLCAAAGQGPAHVLWQELSAVGPVETARSLFSGDKIGAQRLLAAHDHLQVVARLAGRLVTPDDEEWPAGRFAAFTGGAGADQHRFPPLCLWILGERRLPQLLERAVTVTGSRAASNYGSYVTAEIVGDLAVAGCTVVAGAGFGVDAAAHRAALAVDAPTVAVLACGIDLAHPIAHAGLLREIATRGAVVSEFSPGTIVTRSRVVARARLLAGFADAVVIPEAGLRSGARTVAAHAAAIGRPVFAVPGPITSAVSAGCHDLIRTGQARLATHARDVLDALGTGTSQPGPTSPRDRT